MSLRRLLSFFGLKNPSDKISKGIKGEDIARQFLSKKGYKIVERNFKIKGGEADLIAKFQEKIIIIEVKTRSSEKFGTPQSAVNRKKFKRLLLAGTVYCRKNGLSTKSLQIDVVAIQIKNGEPSVRHFENINLLD
ncbi:MAG: YraN family protein [Acidobacteria bacterium]|nr:YraN family protein [Acidobacteriota bacterium]